MQRETLLKGNTIQIAIGELTKEIAILKANSNNRIILEVKEMIDEKEVVQFITKHPISVSDKIMKNMLKALLKEKQDKKASLEQQFTAL